VCDGSTILSGNQTTPTKVSQLYRSSDIPFTDRKIVKQSRKSQLTAQNEVKSKNVPGEIKGTDGQPTPKHVNNFHGQIETTGRLVQADTDISRC